MHTVARLRVLFALVALCALFAPAAPAAQAKLLSDSRAPGRDRLQFTASGRVLSFEPTGVYVASGSGLLRLEFAGTAGVAPIPATPRSAEGPAQPLEPVTYANLWDGITVTFQPVPGGLYKSTYLLAPGVAADAIHLRYNVPVEIDALGNLILRLPTGEYQESAPVAWQDIEGERVPVEVAFQPLAERESGFRLGRYNPAYPLVIDPTLQWNTFLGSASDDAGTGIAVDASGNVYIVGNSDATWGDSPRRPYAGSGDAFVAKLSSGGTLLWNTFLGGTSRDNGRDIAVDSSGNAYVIGRSEAAWGDAKRPYANLDAFVAKLDSSGALQWNTFLGAAGCSDDGTDIAVDASGNIYATGSSYGEWGTVNPEHYVDVQDGYVAKLGSDGTLLWNSFLGGLGYDVINGIALDSSGNAYVAGNSDASWGSPRRDFSTGNFDAFVAKLNSSGLIQWNTFLGSSAQDAGNAITVDNSGNMYVVGLSYATWGDSPRRPYSAFWDIFVAMLDNSGVVQWNTFLGSSSSDMAGAISLDGSGHLYVTGYTVAWGSPIRPNLGGYDASVSKLDSDGALLWNTFLGGAGNDTGMESVVDASGNIYVIGESDSTWGSPLESFHGTTSTDAFVARIRKDNSTTTLSAHTPNPSLPGQSVTISYTVAADPPGSLNPTGSVTVGDGTVSCSGTIAAGHCALTFATAGAKSLIATYSGDTDFAGSSSAVTGHQVNTANTTTSITGHTPNPSLVGQAYSVSWTVSVAAPAGGTPTGSVTVADGSGGSCMAAVAAGHCALVSATPGTKTLSATFSGDSNLNVSSGTATHEVKNPEVKSNEYRIYLPLLRR